MSTSDRWAKAYARQANADLATWIALAPNESIPECHKLLFLQMACEKLVKAHLCSKGTDPADVQASHGYTAKNLPIIIREHLVVLARNPTRLFGLSGTRSILPTRLSSWRQPSAATVNFLTIASTLGRIAAAFCICPLTGRFSQQI